MVRIAAAVVFSFLAAAPALAGPTMEAVQKRGYLTCGVAPASPGFSVQSPEGEWSGFDVDFCRALSSAIFGAPDKARFLPVAVEDRFKALQAGEVDVLSRMTAWTLGRENEQRALFAAVTYYDGLGFIVRKQLNVSAALELSGASVCFRRNPTVELNLADFFRSHSMKYDLVAFDSQEAATQAYDQGKCDVLSSDLSRAFFERARLSAPQDHVVLGDMISKEPLGPVVRQGDSQWFNFVRWTHFVMLAAEELEVTRENVDDRVKSPNPQLKRLLGSEGDFGAGFNVPKDWGYRIVKNVGNYGESFERNFDPGGKLKINRGLNGLWTKGGLQFSPPIR